MDVQELIGTLGYDRSPHFLANESLRLDPEYGHLYRKAEEGCGLRGVYVLRRSAAPEPGANTPVVYLCEAKSTADAEQIHRRVWNQNIVPFLLVRSPREIRLYSGFRYARVGVQEKADDPARGILRAAIQFNEVSAVLADFRAEAIDDGGLWRTWNRTVTPDTRVDWKLLASLDRLDKRLLSGKIPNRCLSHALIGKFVYLHYLRARDILSDRKLAEFGLQLDEVLGRNVRLHSFLHLLNRLDDWLNGSIFPLSDEELQEIGEERIRQVAGVFRGDTPEGQRHLDFDAYDFSYIPIETLSVIYQQFLHAAEHSSGRSQGRERGAYYTPVPLANFILDTLDSRKPLREGMRVLDPACGSGVFLVQCYRKLIEQRVRRAGGVPPRPEELSRLMTEHLYGIDTDPDACQVAEFSLILTLLDYVKPPDLSETDFRLPTLGNHNIFQGDTFDPQASWADRAYCARYDWVVGNPPWKELKSGALEPADTHVFAWMKEHRRDRPTGGNQVAEAFAWRACDFVNADGVVGLLLPAMTLFKYESARFRGRFLNHAQIWYVANFSNLAEILFAGRSRVPAAAYFYSCAEGARPPESIMFYSPFVANQVLHNPGLPGSRKQVWAIVVNASEIRDVPYSHVVGGRALPWKAAFWGSGTDERILQYVERHFPSLMKLERDGAVVVSEGLQLRRASSRESLDARPELAGMPMLDVSDLDRRRYLFTAPDGAIRRISADMLYARKGRFELPMRIAQPPHVVVSAARNFALYNDEFLIIPPRQIGIAADRDDADFLIALTLYLNSDFVTYHQFFTAPEFGIKRSRGTLRALRALPIPLEPGDKRDWSSWKALYEQLRQAEAEGLKAGRVDWYAAGDGAELLQQLNAAVSKMLGLDRTSQAAVHDLVHVRRALVDGQVGEAAVGAPEPREIATYAAALQAELDGFLEGDVAARHRVTAVHGADSGMVQVDLVRNTVARQPVSILRAEDPTAREFQQIRDRLREKRSQWVYFDRNLRIYEETRTYLFKPMQHLHWTESQAITDAGEIIADTLELAPRDYDAAHFTAR